MSLEKHLYLMYLASISGAKEQKPFEDSSISDLCDTYNDLFNFKTCLETEISNRLKSAGHGDIGFMMPWDQSGVKWEIKETTLKLFTLSDDIRMVWSSEEIDAAANPYRTDGGGITVVRLADQSYAILDSNLEIKKSWTT